jgi:DNA-binding CsgD family transcriptional regulator
VNDDQNISASNRFLEFLSHAYCVPFEPGALEDFLASASDCLLYSERNNLPSDDIGNIADLSDKHADHNDRLNKIFDAHTYEHLIDPTQNWSKQHSVGNIIVDLTQSTCFGNSIAQDYLGQTLPAQLGHLNLTSEASNALHQALTPDPFAEKRAADTLVQISTAARPAHIPARISFSHSNRGPIAEITFFLFSWDATSLSEFRDQFDLTKTETDILALILNGKSQLEIAHDRGRSNDTIKLQVRALLKKTNCTKSTELVRQVMGYQILQLALQSNVAELQGAHTVAVFPTHSDQTITVDGRAIQINLFGPTTGRPVVLVHGLIWGPFVTPTLLRILHRENIQLIAPFRAGFGGTAPPRVMGRIRCHRCRRLSGRHSPHLHDDAAHRGASGWHQPRVPHCRPAWRPNPWAVDPQRRHPHCRRSASGTHEQNDPHRRRRVPLCALDHGNHDARGDFCLAKTRPREIPPTGPRQQRL